MLEHVKSTRPVMTSVSASGMPLNGTWIASNPALTRKRSVLRWVAEPTPAVAKVSPPGLDLAAATRSFSVLKPFSGETTVTLGELPSDVTAAKSRAVS